MAEDTLINDANGPLIWINPERMGGTPCFYGTRLPIKTFFDYLEANYSLDEFLDCFPSVNREMLLRLLERSESMLLAFQTA